jgi:hypothetical protein
VVHRGGGDGEDVTRQGENGNEILSDESSDESSDDESLIAKLALNSALSSPPSSPVVGLVKRASLLLLRTSYSLVKTATSLTLSAASKLARASPLLSNFIDEVTTPSRASADPEAAADEFVAWLDSKYGARVAPEDSRIDGECSGLDSCLDSVLSANIKSGPLPPTVKSARSSARLILLYIPSTSATPTSLQAERSLAASVRSYAQSNPSAVVHGIRRSHATKLLSSLSPVKLPSHPGPLLLVLTPPLSSRSTKAAVAAQHHCNPPPSVSDISSWVKVLKKRHGGHLKKIRLANQEEEFGRERERNYRDGRVKDEERKKLEIEAKERQEERQEFVEARREKLREGLADEPKNGPEDGDVVTVRVECSGRDERRRFSRDATMSDIFDWIDVTFEVEREKVQLAGGGKEFTYKDFNEKSLKEIRAPKMWALKMEDEEP